MMLAFGVIIYVPVLLADQVSHYEFLKTVVGFKKEFKFCIETIDGIVYEFDVKTGKILSERNLVGDFSLFRNTF